MAKKDYLNRQHQKFAQVYAETGNGTYAAVQAGYDKSPAARASQNLSTPKIQAEIARIQQAILYDEILPLATAAHKRILSDPKTPAGAVVQAVKLAYDRTLGSDEAGATKQPHEMSPDELALAIAALTRAAAEKAKDVEAVIIEDNEQQQGAAADIFD